VTYLLITTGKAWEERGGGKRGLLKRILQVVSLAWAAVPQSKGVRRVCRGGTISCGKTATVPFSIIESAFCGKRVRRERKRRKG